MERVECKMVRWMCLVSNLSGQCPGLGCVRDFTSWQTSNLAMKWPFSIDDDDIDDGIDGMN